MTRTQAFSGAPVQSTRFGASDGSANSELIELLEAAERQAWKTAYRSAPESLKAALGLQVVERDGITALVSPKIDSLVFNRIFVHPHGPRSAELGALIGIYRSVGVSRYLLHVPPGDGADHVRAALPTHGLVPFTRDWIKFAGRCHTKPRVHTDLVVRSPEAHEAEGMAKILAHGLDVPDSGVPFFAQLASTSSWKAFVACEGRTPVAAALLCTVGPVGYLGGAATLPSHRRRGGQGVLLATRIQAALEAGCEFISSETGELRPGAANMSYRNMIRAGLSPVYLRENFAPAGVTWT